MKKQDVPQDEIPAFQGHLRKGLYAVDDNGDYVLQASSGWSAEQTVLDLAISRFEEQASVALQDAREGKASPLAYHMYCQRMDHKQLAASSGRWLWQVKRHCKPKPFSRLSQTRLQEYAAALGLSIGGLLELPDAVPAND